MEKSLNKHESTKSSITRTAALSSRKYMRLLMSPRTSSTVVVLEGDLTIRGSRKLPPIPIWRSTAENAEDKKVKVIFL